VQIEVQQIFRIRRQADADKDDKWKSEKR